MLFLTLETFNKTGGLQSASRNLAKALAEISSAKSAAFRLMSLCDAKCIADNRYINPTSFKGFNYNRIRFFLAAIYHGLSSKTIVLSHINLVPIAYCLKMLVPDARIILIAHGKEVWADLRPWKNKFLASRLEIWAVSQFTKDILINKQGVNGSNIMVLNNCLDPYFNLPSSFSKPAYLLDRYRLEETAPVIFSVSRIAKHERNKGYDEVLECLHGLSLRYPRIKYILAGKMEEAEHRRILRKIDVLNISTQVILPGYISDSELADHYLLSDIFIMPSSKEGFGLVFLEALACGRQVIAGNKDGSLDALRNGELGTLIDPASKKEISEALLAGLQKPRNHAAKELQQKTVMHFNFDRYKSRVNALLSGTNLNEDRVFIPPNIVGKVLLISTLLCAPEIFELSAHLIYI
jgi:phosphatidylinositol alpha-1,6-mannosyltransferase